MNNVEVVKFLLKNRAQVDQQDNYGSTALMKASHYNNVDSVKILHYY